MAGEWTAPNLAALLNEGLGRPQITPDFNKLFGDFSQGVRDYSFQQDLRGIKPGDTGAMARMLFQHASNPAEAIQAANYGTGLADRETFKGFAEKLGNIMGGTPQAPQAPGAPKLGPISSTYGPPIAKMESGGNYAAVGPPTNGRRPLGKYQVMEDNVPEWTQAAIGRSLTPEEFLTNPEAQEAVFEHRFGSYVQKYGPEGAAKAWFGGERGMNNPNARDVNGMTVARYGQGFSSGLPQQQAAATPAPLPAPPVATPSAVPPQASINEPPAILSAGAPASVVANRFPTGNEEIPTAENLIPQNAMALQSPAPPGQGNPVTAALRPPAVAPPPAPAVPPVRTAQAGAPTSIVDPVQQRLMQALPLLQQMMMHPGLPPGVRESIKPIYEHAIKQGDLTNDQKEYIGAVRQGYKKTFPEYQIELKQAGAPPAAEKAGDVEMAKLYSKRLDKMLDAGDKAQSSIVDINTLRETSGRLGSQGQAAPFKETVGPYLEALGIKVEGLSDLQTATSVINRLAPQSRAANSGSTSDIEYKGMLRAAPSMLLHPTARNTILDTMEALARDDLAKAEIAQKVVTKELTPAQAQKALHALPDPMTGFKDWRKANPDVWQAVRTNTVQNEKPAAPKPTSQFNEGQTATGPNGQKMIFRNGNWGPM